MVLVVAAGVAAVKGGIAVKQHIETRKNPTLDGDFITAPIDTLSTATKDGSQRKANLKDKLRSSLTNAARTIQRGSASLPQSFSQSRHQQKSPNPGQCKTREPIVSYQLGQEVRLQHMSDPRLNGKMALVMQDFGPKGVLVQFMSSSEGIVGEMNGFHESGLHVLPENLEPMLESTPISSPSPEAEAVASASTMSTECRTPCTGSVVELRNLSTASDKNGLRGMVVVPPGNMVLGKGRVAVKLFENTDTASLGVRTGNGLISVKLENCKVVDGTLR